MFCILCVHRLFVVLVVEVWLLLMMMMICAAAAAVQVADKLCTAVASAQPSPTTRAYLLTCAAAAAAAAVQVADKLCAAVASAQPSPTTRAYLLTAITKLAARQLVAQGGTGAGESMFCTEFRWSLGSRFCMWIRWVWAAGFAYGLDGFGQQVLHVV
jgi:hypothetical protein